MIIANPIFDTVFKRLMEDKEASKFIVSTLLGKPVISIEVKSQEVTYTEDEQSKSQAVALRLYRLDFVATIQTGDNEYTNVLIEVQKALKITNLNRFRNYIAEQYKRKDTVGGKKTSLPIITIYILGFELPEIATSCVRVNKNYFDAVHETDMDVKSHFIERIMHDCVVVQARKIEKERYATNLDKLLSVFIQDDFVDDEKTKYYPYFIEDENIRRITDILHYCASDTKERTRIKAEIEAWETYQELLESSEKDNLQTIERQDAALAEDKVIIARERAEKEAAIARERAALAEKEAAIARERAAIAEKEVAIARERAAIAEKEALLAELARLKTQNQ
ncbi:MAG: hypothetical protein LBB73_03270 [Dysgonamonadaceae bacterium]|jgi:hypothetical protein|nr:hypothetical protein [Dysgonamonadaceae bacterium]